MAAIFPPRRILGVRDVNKPILDSPSALKSSPLKPSPFPIKSPLSQNCMDLDHLTSALLPPKYGAKAQSSSPSNRKKRGVECLEDAQDGPLRKQAVVEVGKDDHEGIESETGDLTPNTTPGSEDSGRVRRTLEEPEGRDGVLARSPSPDSSFNQTQDSWVDDSQNTTLTEPEDAAPFPIPTFAITQPLVQRVFSQEEARENAEALRLRLTMALYKVQTNQTDIPLSRLQIRSSSTSPNITSTAYPSLTKSLRKPLPASRPSSAARLSIASNPTQDVNLDSDCDDEIEIEITHSAVSIPSPSTNLDHMMSPVRNQVSGQQGFATPVLPRSRDRGPLYPNGNVQDSPMATSSVVKGRAADGLLRLMGGPS